MHYFLSCRKASLDKSNYLKLGPLVLPWKGHMCCNLAEVVGSREHWLWDTARKRNVFLLISIFFNNPSIASTLEPLVQFRWGSQQNVYLLISTALESNRKLKCHMFNFRLISLDCILCETCFYKESLNWHTKILPVLYNICSGWLHQVRPDERSTVWKYWYYFVF